MELRVDVINVESILEDVIGTVSILATKSELMLYVHRDVPAKLIGDSGKLRQVIMNLVGMYKIEIVMSVSEVRWKENEKSEEWKAINLQLAGNSVKFTPTGQIFVSCVVEKWLVENVLLKFEVL